ERTQNAFEPRGRAPNDLQTLAHISGLVPTVAVVMGPSAGHGALTAPLMDFVVMVEGASLFSAGPPLVKEATGEDVTKEVLGGTAVHTTVSGVAHKAAHFIDVADAFHLPLVFLADNPGVLAGTAAERSGVLRHAARMFAAQARVRSPKLHVTLRKAYGFGSSLMAMNPFDRQTVTLALPGARLGAMPATGGGAAAGVDDDAQRVLAHAELGGAYSS